MSKKAPVWATPFGTLAYAYIAKPDDKTPEGVDFEVDGKFKGTLVFDDAEDLAEIRKLSVAYLRSRFPEAPTDEDELKLPVKPGEAFSGKKGEALAGKTVIESKSKFQPKIYDAAGALCPAGVFAHSGDTVRFKVSPYAYKKTEKVREGKKTVDLEVFGVSLRLSSVQIKKKGSGEDGSGFDAVEDGDFNGSTAGPREERPARSERTTRPAASNEGDF